MSRTLAGRHLKQHAHTDEGETANWDLSTSHHLLPVHSASGISKSPVNQSTARQSQDDDRQQHLGQNLLHQSRTSVSWLIAKAILHPGEPLGWEHDDSSPRYSTRGPPESASILRSRSPLESSTESASWTSPPLRPTSILKIDTVDDGPMSSSPPDQASQARPRPWSRSGNDSSQAFVQLIGGAGEKFDNGRPICSIANAVVS